MNDRVEFLNARLDEEERDARAATPGPWRWTGDYPEGACPHGHEGTDHGPDLQSGDDFVIMTSGYDASSLSIKDADAEHIARHDPARVLAEVEAKRRILALHDPSHDPCDAHDASLATVTCDTLRLLALPYVEHPDYRQEWAPA